MENLAQFKQTYFDESAELLGVAEAGLLRLAPDAVDPDEVNAVFRAVHSIKGGAGAFGFQELVAFAHEFEAVMDGVRSNRIPVTTDLVDVLIRANDVLAQLVAYARDETPPPAQLGYTVLQDLRLFGEKMEAVGPSKPQRPPLTAVPGVAPAEETETATYVIRFKPRADLLLSGNDPVFLLRALSRLGEASIECDVHDVPPLDQLNPEALYLSWTIRLETSASPDQIDDVFEFVSDESIVDVLRLDGDEDSAEGTAEDDLASLIVGPAALPLASAPVVAIEPAAEQHAKLPDSNAAPAAPVVAGSAPSLGGHTIRVDLEKIDRLVNMVGEMVITQAMVAEHVRELPPGHYQDLLEGLEQLAQHTRELRESVMSIRAQPVGSVFSRMPRLVRELAHDTGKDVRLVMSGEATEVDKTVIENLVDPITHMIRNCIDHGLEPPEERERAGKPRTGLVSLSAQHRSGRIVIEVTDDGRGLDRARILAKAVERGLVAPGATLADEEVEHLIFQPGFSTAEAVTNISGRGVGMDVVRRNITALGGRIGITSTSGEGSRFTLSLPLTLAVLDGMVISVGAERFVLPLTNIVESLRPKDTDIHMLANRCEVIMARGEYVRLVHLDRLFGIAAATAALSNALVVLTETESGERLGLVVDEVLGQQQVVIKSLDANFRRIDGVAAATILGDGRVALILDVAGLQDMSRRSAPRLPQRIEPPRSLETA